ncbi:MAG TPA: 3-oxoacyl-ACP reductase FabG [Burkholderiales bacterium]|nr:3-oxoacyl-ACP reductase FabG [Burkholderiales bacterium]
MTIGQNPARHAAFVTGSGRNIGRAIALDLARRGMNVVVQGRNRGAAEETAAAVREAGGEALVVLGDLGAPKDVAAMAEQALARFGAIDILVNNAAIRPESALEKLSLEDWHRVFDVNLHSAFALTKAFVPGMKQRGFGRIVYFTGMNAMHGYAQRPHVSASKHALWGLTKALAKELGPSGITVNAISPGPIATEHPENPAMAKHIASLVGRVPLGRLGTSEEVAALCGFLCSAEAAYVSGQMIAANGAAQT